MTNHYVWTAELVIPTQGLHDASGAHRSALPVTEAGLKAAVVRDVAARHNCDPAEVLVTSFSYSEVI